MAPQTPLLLVENFADTVNLFPTASLTADAETTGREAYRVADYRRERSWWQPPSAAANHSLQLDLGSGVSAAADYMAFDRGHNLWGHTVTIKSATDGVTFSTTVATLVVPALVSGAFPVGGDPTTGWSVTEEGAIYTLFSGAATKRGWQALFPDNFQPIVPGWMVGRRVQLLGYSSVRDEDAMMRSEITERSRALYRGTDKRYTARTLLVRLSNIGSAEYDGTMRTLRRQLFELDQPAMIAMDYGTKPERVWLYQYDGTTYSAPMSRVYRGIEYRFGEVGPLSK